jgi:hypothetical protein
VAIAFRWQNGATGLLMALALAGASGCASDSSPLGNASTVDREFAAAAITWDLNRDGEVTCDEWKQYATGLFRSADANRDGFLSPEEFAAMARQDRLFDTGGFKFFDMNGDGRVTLEELTGKPNPAFALLDKNKDCVIGRDERVVQRGPSEESREPQMAPSGRKR